MKHAIVIGLVVAELVIVAAFFGVGFGTAALSVAGAPALTNTCSGPGGLDFCVNFSTAPNLGGVFVSNWINGQSTPITFSVYNTVGTNGDCSQQPGWIGGAGHLSAFAEVQIIDSLTGQPVSLVSQSVASFQSEGTVTASATAFFVSFNGSVDQGAYCYGNTARSQTPQTDWLPNTFSLVGQFDDYSRVSVTFYTTGQYCNGGPFGGIPACSQDGVQRASSGTWTASAVGQVYLRNGGGSFAWNSQTLYNGQTFTVPVTTHYDAGQGFELKFLYPSARGSGTIASAMVPDDKTDYGVTFTVPSNAASNSTNPGWNWFQLALYSPVAQYTYEVTPIDVSPLYAPPAPKVSYQDLAGNNPPQLGDQLDFAISAAGIPAQGERIVSITMWAWYLSPGIGAGLPASGSSAWITPGGQGGDALTIAANGYNATATYTATVTQPYDIAYQVESVTNTAQTSASATGATIYVQPPDCSGSTCNAAPASNLWGTLGPALLSLAVILAAVIVAIVAPLGWGRYLVVALAIGGVVVLYVFDWGGAFVVGGLLNHAGG